MFDNPSEGRKTFQPLGEPTRLSTSIFCENKDAHKSLDSPLVYIGAHNVLNMLNDCTKCWHLAFC
ncbi:hypothetical protein, partial [Escherichia coli]|uniref:hypothetical protein n=1 Tax=Escherichia coli TaxID=562 RepID=UPI001BD290E0